MGDDSDVEETPVTFHVKSSSDAKWTLSLEPSTTVADLKAKLAGSDYADVDASRQRLIYSGRVLKDGDTLATYNVKDGHTIHLVRSAQSNQTQQQQQRGSAPQTSAPDTGRSTPGQAPAGVPSNIAAGTGNNPLAGLTGARYAGFAQLPGAGQFGPDGGVSRLPIYSACSVCSEIQLSNLAARWGHHPTPNRCSACSKTRNSSRR